MRYKRTTRNTLSRHSQASVLHMAGILLPLTGVYLWEWEIAHENLNRTWFALAEAVLHHFYFLLHSGSKLSK